MRIEVLFPSEVSMCSSFLSASSMLFGHDAEIELDSMFEEDVLSNIFRRLIRLEVTSCEIRA